MFDLFEYNEAQLVELTHALLFDIAFMFCVLLTVNDFILSQIGLTSTMMS